MLHPSSLLACLLLFFAAPTPTNATPPSFMIPESEITNPSLYPHIQNGFIGTITSSSALYVSSLFTSELEWLEAACLSISKSSNPILEEILNPGGGYELSGLCGKLDDYLKEKDIDPLEHGYGARKARLQNPFAYDLKLNNRKVSDLIVTLDTTTSTVSMSNEDIRLTWYASASSKNLYVNSIIIKNSNKYEVTYDFKPKLNGGTDDISFSTDTTGNSKVCKSGEVAIPEKDSDDKYVSFCYTALPSTIKIKPGETFSQDLVFVVNLEDTVTTVSKLYDDSTATNSTLYSDHLTSWALKSTSAITTKNETLNEQISSTMYALQTSLNADHPFPTSPGGTSTNGYFGLYFWDSDIWIASSLLLLNPAEARTSSYYRVSLLDKYLQFAKDNGNEGCRVVWQSGSTGNDASLLPYANLAEEHITGDTSFYLRSLYYVTKDTAWLSEMQDLIFCIADYWQGRVDENGSIKGVIGPDEFASGGVRHKGVDDNPYTNLIAKRALEFGDEVSKILNEQTDNEWLEVANKIVIIFDMDMRVHPQYVNFPEANKNHQFKVKQADVTLLNHPLNYEYEADDVLLNDLLYYDELYDPDGPGMTKFINLIGYARAGEAGKVEENYDDGMANQQKEFGIWTETPDPEYHPSDMGCYNFLTGAGGMLQGVVHGFFGLRFDSVDKLTGKVTWLERYQGELKFTNLKWKKRVFNIFATETTTTIEEVGGKEYTQVVATGENYEIK
ncbi:hypothetical protein TrLO_g9680 [Triparma laevis f. longispina]|nr:hypothetical protein TrLO_g9680 [Triparma laevis f. longispina]